MRIITPQEISKAVADLCLRAGLYLRKDVLFLLKKAYAQETNKKARYALRAVIENASAAAAEKLAICQDTGFPVVFVEIGQEVRIKGDLKSAVNKGAQLGYKKGCFRNSVVKDPLLRGKSSYTPVIVHAEIVKGDNLKITVYPRGFGCENKSRLKMFNPTAGLSDVKNFIIEAVKLAGPDACPPYIIGVGIGGTADYAGLLAKKALLKNITKPGSRLETELLKKINKLNIGPMGLGGRTTVLAVRIAVHATHIAGLPVAVNISCHALRSATRMI